MPRTGDQAITWLDAQNGSNWYRKCLMGVRMSFGLPGGTLYAGQAWDNAKHKHRVSRGSQVPRGVPVFWETSGVADHIALSVGGGMCLSNDARRRGYYDRVSIDSITRNWGADLQGWTEDLNGHRVYSGGVGLKQTTLDLSKVVAATKSNGKVANGTKLKRAVAAEVGKGSMILTNATLGDGFQTQYRHVQEKYLTDQGAKPRPGDLDGIPGKNSLMWLGRRHGFRVQM